MDPLEKVAARLGLEPRQNESESFVLPLHHRAKSECAVGGMPRLRIHGLASTPSRAKGREYAIRRAAERRMEPAMGFEPATACLQNRCSTIELRRRDITACEVFDWENT